MITGVGGLNPLTIWNGAIHGNNVTLNLEGYSKKRNVFDMIKSVIKDIITKKYIDVIQFYNKEGISVSFTVKNNYTDLLIVEKRINDSLKLLLVMSSMFSSDSYNVDVELISYLAQSAIVLAVNVQASLSRVRRNNIAKETYGSDVFLPIKIKDTPKMFDETETVRSNTKKLVNSSGYNTTGNNLLILHYYDCQLNINRKDNGILQSLEIPFEIW
ncbi:hypothetical protein ACTFIW_003252 [Dictyostelium discoideum]